MKSLKEYLAESEKTYDFRFKSIVELTDEQLDKFERHLRKYEAFDIESPKKTIMQRAPMDFYNTDAGEVFIIDFKTKLPATPPQLTNEIIEKLGIAERDFRVRSKGSPAEMEDALNIDNDSAGPVEKSALLDDENYSEVEGHDVSDYTGEEHKTKFLKDLETHRKSNPIQTEYKIGE